MEFVSKPIKLIPVTGQVFDACNGCICSVCLVAETNGGADGCGNCKECKGENPCCKCETFYSAIRLVPVNK